mgnify:CR=1 FL=1
MSILVRLLTTGRSLVDLKNTASRYRMRQKNPLPNFGSEKNPFAAAPATVAPHPKPRVERRAGRELTAAEKAAAQMKETMRLPKATVAPRAEGFLAPAAASSIPASSTGTVSRTRAPAVAVMLP